MMRYNYGFSILGIGMIFLIILAVLTLLIVGIILAVRYLKRSGSAASQQPYGRSLDILNERYAKGEISEEEYKKIKSDIMS